MLRIVLPILVALLMIGAALLIVFTPSASPVSVATTNPTTAPAQAQIAADPTMTPPEPARVPPPAAQSPLAPPAKGRTANTLLLNPFPKDAALAPTLVTLDVQNADITAAYAALVDAMHVSAVNTSKAQLGRIPPQSYNFHLANQPLLEALYQFESQTSTALTITAAQQLNVQYNSTTPKLPGQWCVSGPFALAANVITHTYSTGRNPGRGTPNPTVDGPGYTLIDTFTIQFASRVEPKLHALQYPGTLELVEVTDEKGHSLIPPAANAVTGAAGRGTVMRGGRPVLTTAPTFTLPLLYPAQDSGRLIKTLKAKGDFVVQSETTAPVVFDDPTQNEVIDRKVGGLTVSSTKLVWSQAKQAFDFTVTLRRDTISPAVFELISRVLEGSTGRPVLDMDPAFTSLATPNVSSSNDQIVAQYTFRTAMRNGNGNNPPQTQAPSVAKVTLNLPTDSQQVTVPFEFHDLPLP